MNGDAENLKKNRNKKKRSEKYAANSYKRKNLPASTCTVRWQQQHKMNKSFPIFL